MFTSTGQGLLGNNMFAYCGNSPCNFKDPEGHAAVVAASSAIAALAKIAVAAAGAYLLLKTASAVVKTVSKAVSTASSAIADAAKKAAEKIARREHSVYHLKDGDKVEYVGRTKSVSKRKAAHKRNPKRKHLEMDVVATGLTYMEARALEQVSMVYNHTINTANEMNNQINGMAPKYWGAIAKIALGTIDYAGNKITNEILCWAEG